MNSSFSKELALAEEQFDRGLYFEAHETLELAWRAARGEEKIGLQGMIQVAAGLHKIKFKGKVTAGARYLLNRGMDKFEKNSDWLEPGARRRWSMKLARLKVIDSNFGGFEGH